MFTMRTAVCFAALSITLLSGPLCLARQSEPLRFEYGSPEELKGVTKIFIDVDGDLDVHQNIVKTIAKKVTGLTIVNRIEEAEVVLTFTASNQTYFAGVSGRASTTTYGGTSTTNASAQPNYRTATIATAKVWRAVDANTIRLLMDFGDSRTSRFERRPSTNFARAFADAYVKANPDAKKK